MVDKDYGSSPPDSANSLWYRSKTNWFEDEDGTIIYDLSEFFDTWQLDKWKKQKDYGMLQDKKVTYGKYFTNTMSVVTINVLNVSIGVEYLI